MALVKPRLNDYFDLPFTQEQADFAIPFLHEDIPLYVDPFLLFKSPSQQDQALHGLIVNSFNRLGWLVRRGRAEEAANTLVTLSECQEVGMGTAATRRGLRIGKGTANQILQLFQNIPQIAEFGFTHFEEIQFFVEHISKDRVSDFACCLLKSFLIDYTTDACRRFGVPVQQVVIPNVYNHTTYRFIDEVVDVPVNPETRAPLLLVPKRWLRFLPWLNFDDFFTSSFVEGVPPGPDGKRDRIAVLNYNRHNYGMVQEYVRARELRQEDCNNDPLFKPIPITFAKRKLAMIKALPSGKSDNADRKYEQAVSELLASLLYPDLDYADLQSRTESGVLIRDLIFYNNRSTDFLKDIHETYNSRQIVFELKNVRAIEREHINQLNRYLVDHLGRFGVFVTRHPLPKSMLQSTIDLWSGPRKCIVTMTDHDLETMVALFEGKQRPPLDVLKKSHVEFMRKVPS